MGCRKSFFAMLLLLGGLWSTVWILGLIGGLSKGGIWITETTVLGQGYRSVERSLNMELIFAAVMFLVGITAVVISIVQLAARSPAQLAAEQTPATRTGPATTDVERGKSLAYYTPPKTAGSILQGVLVLVLGGTVTFCALWPMLVGYNYRYDVWAGDPSGQILFIMAAAAGGVIALAGLRGIFAKPRRRALSPSRGGQFLGATIKTIAVLLVISLSIGVLAITNPSEADHKRVVYQALHETAAEQGALSQVLSQLSVTTVEEFDLAGFQYNSHLVYSTLSFQGVVLSYGVLGQVLLTR